MADIPHSESHCWVNESSSERHLTTRYWEESRQLAQTQHDGDTGRRYDEVSEQKAQRTTSGEGLCSAQKKASADDTADAGM